MLPLLLGAVVGWVAAKGDKPQAVRLLDVFALGPFMILAGTDISLTPEAKKVLMFAGAATITFNGRNFLAQRR